MATVEEGKVCPKCGYTLPNISWTPEKPFKVRLQCGKCGYFEFVDSLDKKV